MRIGSSLTSESSVQNLAWIQLVSARDDYLTPLSDLGTFLFWEMGVRAYEPLVKILR
jgi:hypothetical protein